MFKLLKILCNNVKNLTSDKIFIQVIVDKNIQTFILDLNRIGQLFEKGETANEEYLGNYSITTERLNKGLGNNKTIADHITLKDKGDFYKSFFVRIYKDGFTIVANSIKDGERDLTKIYGEDIIGLSEYSQHELYKKIKPMVIKTIEKQILKGVL
jgi:hypothetical protein